jgi:hypothetical protein
MKTGKQGFVIGAPGFEPGTSCSQSRASTLELQCCRAFSLFLRACFQTLSILWSSSVENAHMRRLTLLVVLAGIVLSGCSGSTRPDVSSVPAPSLIHFLPRGYRVVKTYRADLSGGVVPDVIVVTSEDPDANPPPRAGDDLQVLSWNSDTRRWWLTFDGRSTLQPNVLSGPQNANSGPGDPGLVHTGTFPVLADYMNSYPVLGRVSVAPLLGGDRDELVFGDDISAGGPGFITVVSFHSGIGKIVYVWESAPGVSWHLSHNVIDAESSVPGDGDSDEPVRTYRFALAARAGRIVEVYDDRPFLGVVLRLPYTPIRAVVVRTDPNGPSAGLLRPGDVILNVENAQRMRYVFPSGRVKVLGPDPRSTLKYDIDFSVDSFKAGQTARLLIERGHKRFTVRVKLGSLISAEASKLRTPVGDEVAL